MGYKIATDGIPIAVYSGGVETMAERIRTLRQSKMLTQEQLGDLCGVTKMAVSHWETGGTANIRLKTFLMLCEQLGTTPHYLIFGAQTRPIRRIAGQHG